MNEELITVANKTSRATGSVGKNALTPKYVLSIATPDQTILDFGAGKLAMHTKMLREHGLNVTAYDFGRNVTHIHDTNALNNKYDIVFASNVLNTLMSIEGLHWTLNQLIECVNDNGELIVNIPASPRKLDVTPEDTHKIVWRKLHEHFCIINRVDGTASAPVYRATNCLPPL